MNSPVRVIHFARVAGWAAGHSSARAGDAEQIVAGVELGESIPSLAGAIVRTSAGWHYAAPVPAPAGLGLSGVPLLRSTHSRADLERQIIRFYRGDPADPLAHWPVAS